MRTSERDGLNANRIIAIFANTQLCSPYFCAMWRHYAVTIRDRINSCEDVRQILIGSYPQ